MTRDDDRDYWRREDARRTELDRKFWRDYERRRQHERDDREYEARRRAQETADGWRAVRDGDTAGALRNFAGTDAAVSYLRATHSERQSHETSQLWTKYVFVTELHELIENVEEAPTAVTFDIGKPDQDGDIVVGAAVGTRTEWFWVRRQLLRQLPPPTPVPPRTREVISELVERGGLFGLRMSMPWTDLPSPFDASLGASRRDQRIPHTTVDSLGKLVDNVAASPEAEFKPQRVDHDGDGVVEVRFEQTTERFFIKAALLAQLTAFAEAPEATMPLLRALGQLSGSQE